MKHQPVAVFVAQAFALLSTTTAFSLRHLERMKYQAVMSGPPPTCYIENGFDYVGNDISSASGPVDSCCNKCAAISGCTAWSWTDLNGGTCWLKSARGEIRATPNVKSAVLTWGYQPYCQVSNDLDYPGNDIGRVSSPTVDGCCDICHNYAGCRAYSWSDYQGGSCWLKSMAGQAIVKPGVKSATAYPDTIRGCIAPIYGEDFVGNDITNRPSAEHGGCCDICKTVAGCRAYSWSNYNGGTCWLKSQKGETAFKDGVVSAQVFPNPVSQCSLQNDVDYVGNDISNVQNKDPIACCTICRNTTGCKAFSWSDLNGGTCWLKSGKGAVIPKAGVRSATI